MLIRFSTGFKNQNQIESNLGICTRRAGKRKRRRGAERRREERIYNESEGSAVRTHVRHAMQQTTVYVFCPLLQLFCCDR